MTEKKSGLAFHVHHDILAEWCDDYDERVKYIKETKPMEEQELRLCLFKLIPNDRVPVKLKEAREAYDRAWEACEKVWEAGNKALEAYHKAVDAYDWIRDSYDKALEASYEEIRQLHQELCPDCPWDSTRETIFTRRDVKGIWLKEASNVQKA